ncbi:hypothetical protein CEXT_770131 [Caerostris extrusa]|uniref:Uncharacterized protein n=1 Tax=Caerostris extrusa TaxID=172846 RepID=A0AAV4N0C0_CAEEX|nr:hypothetical protein CEXT_770131 [Caerostris extrusa]
MVDNRIVPTWASSIIWLLTTCRPQSNWKLLQYGDGMTLSILSSVTLISKQLFIVPLSVCRLPTQYVLAINRQGQNPLLQQVQPRSTSLSFCMPRRLINALAKKVTPYGPDALILHE